MKLEKVNKDIIIQYTCNNCGELIQESEYGTNICCICKNSIDETSKFYCLVDTKYENIIQEQNHVHKHCFKKLKEYMEE
jgi:hypothetical protein